MAALQNELTQMVATLFAAMLAPRTDATDLCDRSQGVEGLYAIIKDDKTTFYVTLSRTSNLLVKGQG